MLGVASASQVRWPVFAFTLPVLDFDSWASSWEVAKSDIESQSSVAGCFQDSRLSIGVSKAQAARAGSKYSRRNAIFPATARRNTT